MFVTNRQLNAALNGLRLAFDVKDNSKDKEFYKHFQEALEAGINKCLKSIWFRDTRFGNSRVYC